MKIDLTITYSDLSDKCKEEIEHLKSLGYDVELTYPTLAKKEPSIAYKSYDALDPNSWIYCQTSGNPHVHMSAWNYYKDKVLLNEDTASELSTQHAL